MGITPKTVLWLAPDVTVRFRGPSEVAIEAGRTRIAAGAHGVAIIEAFRTPTTYEAALAGLGERASGMQDYIAMVATVNELVRQRILLDGSVQPAAQNTDPAAFDAARVHVDMLNDRTRTASYLRAIRETVRAGDIVLDIGTGTGVLAVAAAQAGAAHVYAIEASRIAAAARGVFEANGLADRITLIEGESPHVDLPVRADVLVAELIGLDPLGERILETTRDAVTRLLTPSPRLIPSSIDLFAIAVTLPDEFIAGWRFTELAVGRWRRWYDVDFSPLIEYSAQSVVGLSVRPSQLHAWPSISQPVRAFSQDLGAIGDTSFAERSVMTATSKGRIDAVACYFSVVLSPGVVLATDPRTPRDDNHWNHRVWLLPSPIDVEPGDTLELTIRQRMSEVPVELRKVGAGATG